MTANNTLAAKEQVAVLLKDTLLSQDLPKAIPNCFLLVPSALYVRDGFSPTKEDFAQSIAMLSAMRETSGAISSSLNLMLGDAFRLAVVHLGQEEADRLKSDYLHDRGKAQKLVHQIERVCEAFPDPESRGNLEYTHLENLLPWKKRLDEEGFAELVEWAKDGESVSLGGVEVMKSPKPTAVLRARLQELSGKGANVRATLSDPTHDAERLRLAEAACREMSSIFNRWEDEPSYCENVMAVDIQERVSPAISAWEAHVNQKKENLS